MLDFNHQWDDEPDVCAGESVIVLRAVRGSRVDIDDLDASIRLCKILSPLHDRMEFFEFIDLHAKVVEPWRGKKRVGGKQVDEFAKPARVHDEGISCFASIVAFPPTKHLRIEIDQCLSAYFVHQRGVDAERHVIQSGCHESTPIIGCTSTLPAMRPLASCLRVVSS